MTDPSFINTILFWPLINILVLLYQLLFAFHVPFALGFAIILLTILIRILLSPLTASQIKATKKMQKVAPHISALRDKHKGDAKRLQEETMKLYKEHGVNPLGGCLPALLQLPVLWALYPVLQHIVGINPKAAVNEINKIVYFDWMKLTEPWNPAFFGIPLGQSPSQLLNSMGILVFLVPLLTAALQLIQSKMMVTAAHELPAGAKNKKKGNEDFATAFQTQSLYIFPLMIGFLSFSFPMGLSLYWNTYTIFGILQQYKIHGLGGLSDWTAKIKKK